MSEVERSDYLGQYHRLENNITIMSMDSAHFKQKRIIIILLFISPVLLIEASAPYSPSCNANVSSSPKACKTISALWS